MYMLKKEHLLKYWKHRERVAAAKAIIDNKSPMLQINTVSGLAKLKQDYEVFKQRVENNRELLTYFNNVMRTTGIIRSFRPLAPPGLKKHGNSTYEKYLRKIELENEKLGKRILNTKPELHTFAHNRNQRLRLCKRSKRMSSKKKFIIPELILSKYENLNLPHNQKMLRKLFRPKVYLYYAVKGMASLGPIDIELYTEASPQVVLEFVRICAKETNDKLKVVRLFPMLWMESELIVDTSMLVKKNIEYDMRALDHDSSAGILSFSKRSVRDVRRGVINFSISFKPLRVLNGRRIAFGRIVRGLRLLDFIQDFGSKNGKPIKEVVITKCGLHY